MRFFRRQFAFHIINLFYIISLYQFIVYSNTEIRLGARSLGHGPLEPLYHVTEDPRLTEA